MGSGSGSPKRRAAIAAKVDYLYGGGAPFPPTSVINRYRAFQRIKYGGRSPGKVPAPYQSWQHVGLFLDTQLTADEEESASWPRLKSR